MFGALARFAELRNEHTDGRRQGSPSFIIVANQAPGPHLQKMIEDKTLPADVRFIWPQSTAERHPALPTAWDTVADAAAWCIAQAEQLNFSLLSPESLIWKLAGLVQLAATGGDADGQHAFYTRDLPALFEQLIVQLQDFPAPPTLYRPQREEPSFVSDVRIRIICGLSGAGKTAWAAQAAQHSTQVCAYYDAGDLPGPALASTLVRELAARFATQEQGGLRRILLPGASGIEALRTFDTFLQQWNDNLLLVLDNAHRIPVENLQDVLHATPDTAQTENPAHSGGVIDMQRHYQGIDTRWTHRGELLVPVTFTTGLNYENMSENRRGYENFVMNNGVPDFGVKGNKRRDERNLMWNLDPYLQTQWQLTQKLSVEAGVRYSSVWFDSNDHYITPQNGDDSGDASYHKWLPAGAVKYAVTDAWNLYAAAGRGFETPTINELSYRSDGKGGLNINLQPSTNNTYEIGSKTRIGNGILTAALFRTDTDNEIVVDENKDGRTTYKNAGKTRRQGVEIALDQQFAENWKLKMAWTYLDATYRTNVCDKADCSGNRMPGIARNMGYASFGWEPEEGWYAGADARYMSDVMANDTNTAKAPSYTVVGLNTGYKLNYGKWGMDIFGRVDNLFDKEYVGSEIVNAGYNRYYEPAPGRNYGVGLSVSYRFE